MDFLTAFKDLGYPAIISIGLLYIVGIRLGELEKTVLAKIDGVVSNQIKIIETIGKIRATQEDDVRRSGREP